MEGLMMFDTVIPVTRDGMGDIIEAQWQADKVITI
jgi:hypothetical protein